MKPIEARISMIFATAIFFGIAAIGCSANYQPVPTATVALSTPTRTPRPITPLPTPTSDRGARDVMPPRIMVGLG